MVGDFSWKRRRKRIRLAFSWWPSEMMKYSGWVPRWVLGFWVSVDSVNQLPPEKVKYVKSLLAKTTSFAAMMVSIQSFGEEGAEGDDVNDADVASSKPKSLQMRVGKVREKKCGRGLWERVQERLDGVACEGDLVRRGGGEDGAGEVLGFGEGIDGIRVQERGRELGILGLSAERWRY
ncbi:hypothetical protein M0R45_033778 [Rubus argutus]|uniref:Uncharacterized protein n=1 Tax=Rubus argutus TaxID=59490 RepID=A0AAW1WPC0_RUBAR